MCWSPSISGSRPTHVCERECMGGVSGFVAGARDSLAPQRLPGTAAAPATHARRATSTATRSARRRNHCGKRNLRPTFRGLRSRRPLVRIQSGVPTSLSSPVTPCHLVSRARETCQFGGDGTDFWAGWTRDDNGGHGRTAGHATSDATCGGAVARESDVARGPGRASRDLRGSRPQVRSRRPRRA